MLVLHNFEISRKNGMDATISTPRKSAGGGLAKIRFVVG